MPLTVLPSKTLLPAAPRRRPLDGFRTHRLTLVPAPEPRRTGLALLRRRCSAGATASEPHQAVPANVTDIAAFRARMTGAAMQAPAEQAKRRARVMMALAAAAPPLLWLGHAVLHRAHLL